MNHKRVLVWFSCGVTSAVAAKIAIEEYGEDYPIEIVAIDTGSEHEDNWRFLRDVSQWLNHPIKIIKSRKYENTMDVYRKTKYLVGVNGAKCSWELKKKVRQEYEDVDGDLQVFGFDADEVNRYYGFLKNNPLISVYAPLIERRITKLDCYQILMENGINRPITYDMGFNNANCLKSGCVKGGAGYWNHYRKHFPAEFQVMAEVERELDVAINKTYIGGERVRVFLDELDPNAGNYDAEPAFQCGLFCEMPQ